MRFSSINSSPKPTLGQPCGYKFSGEFHIRNQAKDRKASLCQQGNISLCTLSMRWFYWEDMASQVSLLLLSGLRFHLLPQNLFAICSILFIKMAVNGWIKLSNQETETSRMNLKKKITKLYALYKILQIQRYK